MKYKFLLVLFIISFISSILLSFVPVSDVCNLNIGCDVVQDSSYNYTLGIKNSYLGILAFAMGSFLIFSQIRKPTEKKKKIIEWMVGIAALVSLYFLYLQRFIIEAYCEWCLVVDFSMLIALVLILVYRKEK
jgi:uncharacterized membrane protein